MTKSFTEKLARTLCHADPLLPDPDAPVDVKRQDSVRVTVAWKARVPAVQAMLEAAMYPNDKMLEEGFYGLQDNGLENVKSSDSLECWVSMVETASIQSKDH